MIRRRTWALGALCTFCFCFAVSAQTQTLSAPDFAYSGDKGPAFWDKFGEACRATPSAHQSPVDVRRAEPDSTLKPLHLIVNGSAYKLTNPGYTVVATPQATETLLHEGSAYDLREFHVHTLSEHTVAGRHGVMELHAVFRNEDKFVVIGLIFKIGHRNRFLSALLHEGLPIHTDSPAIGVDWLDLKDALTDTARYYTYPGSFTTPPCTESVTWIVLKQWAQMSQDQLEAFRNVVGNDFRPTQHLNNRVIRQTADKSDQEDNDLIAPQ